MGSGQDLVAASFAKRTLAELDRFAGWERPLGETDEDLCAVVTRRKLVPERLEDSCRLLDRARGGMSVGSPELTTAQVTVVSERGAPRAVASVAARSSAAATSASGPEAARAR
jgi:hypothetical protein